MALGEGAMAERSSPAFASVDVPTRSGACCDAASVCSLKDAHSVVHLHVPADSVGPPRAQVGEAGQGTAVESRSRASCRATLS